MPNFIQKFYDLFMKADDSDQERLLRWRKEMDEADRLAQLGGTEPELKSIPRRQSKKSKKPKRGRYAEDG